MITGLDFCGAEAAFERALALEPNFTGARADLAELYARAGRRELACGALARAARPAGPGDGPYARLLLTEPRLERLKKDL